jgi:uncharacterized protein YdeI (YjbR/CyaY-like superfamily)
MQQVYVKTRSAWRDWLRLHHDTEAEIWLVFYKKDTGKPSLDYDAAVEEALCFGWIDSIIKKIDDEKYLRKFTPRKPNSRWSDLNKKRVLKLEQQGLLTKAGIARINEAKESGLWDKSDRPLLSSAVPEELVLALNKSTKAKLFFNQLAPTYRKQFIGWIAMAKRDETKQRRVRESIALLEKGKKLGLK